MRRLKSFAVFFLLAACASPESRIKKNQAAYDAWPPAVQASVKAGKVEVGFTREQARVALGKADRVYTRKSAQAVQEVWAYGGEGARTGLGLGFGTGGGSSVFGLGMGIGGREHREDDRVRVVFEDGKVVAVETRER